MNNRPRILAIASVCWPGGGSEGGAGWLWVRMLARLGEVWVLTLPNSAKVIEKTLAHVSEGDRIHVEAIESPGVRSDSKKVWLRRNYLRWQMAAFRRARALHEVVGFDVVWHLTYSNVWMGSVGALVGPPFVYGPVGGGVTMDWRHWDTLGVRGIVREAIRDAGLMLARFLNPFARISWRRAQMILVQNRETRDWLPRRHRAKARIFPNVVIENVLPRHSRDGSDSRARTAIFVGKLQPLKGLTLAVRTIAALPEWRLQICGAGREESRVRRLARRLGVNGRVEFLGWQPRERVFALLERADVLLFPSFHDQAPWAVAEALSAGLPIVCLDRGGAPLIAGPAGIAVNGDLVEGLVTALRDPRLPGMGTAATERARDFVFDRRLASLRSILREFDGPFGSSLGKP